jgi:chromosome segregation ATPase
MSTGDIALLVIAACQILGIAAFGIAAARILPLLAGLGQALKAQADSLQGELRTTTQAARSALVQMELLLAELRTSGLAQRAVAALDSANSAAGRIDPLAAQMASTLGEARELLDDATQTSQSVRGLAEDLAATNKELTALSGALADIAVSVRDNEVATKLGNVLADTSVLAADIGILAENANAFVETGKPLVAGLKALGRARSSATKLGGSAARLREGLKKPGDRQ